VNIYVGNLSAEVSETELRLAFEQYGTVDAVRLIKDKFTGMSRGFAFVEMSNNVEADAAINGLNSKEFAGSILDINEARPQRDKIRDNRSPQKGISHTNRFSSYGESSRNRPGGGSRPGRSKRGGGNVRWRY